MTTTTQITLHLISDPGHAWIILPAPDAKRLGLTPADFTEFSFTRDGTIYAEEDADAHTVVAAHHRRYGTMPRIIEKSINHDAPLRSYARCLGGDHATRTWQSALRYLASITGA